MGIFKHRVAEAGCQLRQTEPEPPWQMDEEGVICELKKGLSERWPK